MTDVVLGWSESRRDALHAALIGVLVALLFAPALSNGFVNWDDDRVLLDNPAIVSPHGLRRIWSSVELPEGFPNYPLVATSYWVEYRLWGANPLPYHAANILLHGLNAALVFLLLRGLGARPWVAGFAAALFGAHPMQVESVAWVAERKNLVSAAFYLAAFIAYLRHRATSRWGWYGATLALFAAALLSKSATVVLPLSLLLADRFQLGRWSRGSLARMLPLFGLGLAAGLQTLFAESHPAVSVVWWLRPLLAASAVWFYLSKLLLPLGLYPVYPRWDIDPGAVRWWIPVAALAASALLLWYWRPDWRARWGAGHFVVALLPVIGLIPFGFNEMSFVADHEAYLASIGVCLAVAIGVDAWAARVGRPTVNALAAAALLVLGASTVRQIPVWRDSVSLWRSALVGNPAAWVAHNNLAFALLQQRHFDEAVAHLHAAVQIRPDYAEPYTNLALAAYLREDFAAAERYSRRAVEMRPDVADYAKNLALALEAEGNLGGAEEELERALRLQPQSAGLHYLLGNERLKQGRFNDAIPDLERALQLEPDMMEAQSQLGRARLAVGRADEAAAAFADLVQRVPESAESRYNLALALAQLDRRADAVRELRRALDAKPDFAAAQELLHQLAADAS